MYYALKMVLMSVLFILYSHLIVVHIYFKLKSSAALSRVTYYNNIKIKAGIVIEKKALKLNMVFTLEVINFKPFFLLFPHFHFTF